MGRHQYHNQVKPQKAAACPLCAKAMRSASLACPQCGARLHRRCWKNNGGCSICGFAIPDRTYVPGDERPRATVVPVNHPEDGLHDVIATIRTPIGSTVLAALLVLVLQTLFVYHCPFVYHPTLTAMVIVGAPLIWMGYIDRLPPNQGSKGS